MATVVAIVTEPEVTLIVSKTESSELLNMVILPEPLAMFSEKVNSIF